MFVGWFVFRSHISETTRPNHQIFRGRCIPGGVIVISFVLPVLRIMDDVMISVMGSIPRHVFLRGDRIA